MRYKPERALTQEDYLELDMLLSCNNEVQAREGIDTLFCFSSNDLHAR